MKAGDLRHRITIEQPTETQSESGDVTQTWSELATVWAGIVPVGGSESWRAQQANPLLSHQITIRWLAGVTSKMRVKYEDPKNDTTRYFGIDAVVTTDERREEIRLLCVEDVDG